MMVPIAYGRKGLTVQLPESADIIRPRFVAGLPDEAEALRTGLHRPMGMAPLLPRVRPYHKIVIAHSDITRATPNDRILPVLLGELESMGAVRQNITLLNALGTHRRQNQSELRGMLGDRIVDQYRCLQHDAGDDSGLVSLGVTSRGHPVRINRHWQEADIRILTGFIEPHFFAGFSGGPKGILPALAGAESVLTNHGREMIAHPKSTWAVTEGNPIWEEMREVAQRVPPAMILNVTLNSNGEITGVFAGEMEAAHAAGRDFVRQNAMVQTDKSYDIVITSNSGYPLDQNLYQTVKGMSAARRIVRKGGAILMVAGCEDGLPDHGLYAQLLKTAGSPSGLLEMLAQPGFAAQDQWQVQIQAMVQMHADVYVYSDHLQEEQIRQALFIPCRDMESDLRIWESKYGPRICVMPEGPQTIAYLADE